MKRQQKTLWDKVHNSNIFIVILIIALVFSVIQVGKELTSRYQINKEIASLNQELANTQLKKDNLQDLIDYLETDQYVEEQARIQLNLSKSGEKRIDLSFDPQPIDILSPKDGGANWQKWFDYFFK